MITGCVDCHMRRLRIAAGAHLLFGSSMEQIKEHLGKLNPDVVFTIKQETGYSALMAQAKGRDFCLLRKKHGHPPA